ncbi:MAG: glutaconyl-CoA/methylmalonyl-CoA decarboxylase subunit gamma [Candidatus Atribacteria bacterium]|nr:glutaconyl-CoA/methylmalonyl-CoA decarboxylase subunit gamma [Candidatus Atribacteria bacterium]
MRKFWVRVNGEEYEVEVAEVREEGENQWNIKNVKKIIPTSFPLQVTTTLRAPMPGRVLALNVAKGDKVEAGQVVVILEAMKMENEIIAERGGLVKEIYVEENDTVDSGDPILEIEEER